MSYMLCYDLFHFIGGLANAHSIFVRYGLPFQLHNHYLVLACVEEFSSPAERSEDIDHDWTAEGEGTQQKGGGVHKPTISLTRSTRPGKNRRSQTSRALSRTRYAMPFSIYVFNDIVN